MRVVAALMAVDVDPWTKIAAIAAVVAAVVGAIAFVWTFLSNRATRKREDRRDRIQHEVAARQEEMAGDIARLAELTVETAAETKARVPVPRVQLLVDNGTAERVAWYRGTPAHVEIDAIVEAATAWALSTLPARRPEEPYPFLLPVDAPTKKDRDKFRVQVTEHAENMRAQLSDLQAYYDDIANFCGLQFRLENGGRDPIQGARLHIELPEGLRPFKALPEAPTVDEPPRFLTPMQRLTLGVDLVQHDLSSLLKREEPIAFECFRDPPSAEWEAGKVQHLDHIDTPLLFLKVEQLTSFEIVWRVYGDNLVEPVVGAVTLTCEMKEDDQPTIVGPDDFIRPRSTEA